MTDDHPLNPLVRRWSKRAKQSPDDGAAILSLPLVRKTFGKDAYIVREGQATNESCYLISGLAFRQKLLRDGSRQIVSFHVPTEFVDLQNSMLGVADHSVQSLNRCEMAIIPRQALIELGDAHPAVRLAMWIDTLIDGSIFREWMVNVGRRDSRARIAHLLCELAAASRMSEASTTARSIFP